MERSARALEVELNSLGRHSLNASAFEDRGALVHEVLRGCDLFEQDFVSELDSQRDDGAKTGGGGETIRRLFEETLVTNLKRVDLHKFYDLKRVKSVVDASDGYQPHLVAPEMGIRKLIELGLRTVRISGAFHILTRCLPPTRLTPSFTTTAARTRADLRGRRGPGFAASHAAQRGDEAEVVFFGQIADESK